MTTDQNSEENLGYRANPAISNSDLRYLHSPRLFQLNKARQLEEEKESWLNDGTLIEHYLLKPDTFNDKYVLQPEFEAVPGSPNQKQFVDLCLNIDPEDKEALTNAYCECYKVSKKDLESGVATTKAEDLYNSLSQYIEFYKSVGDRHIYSSQMDEMLKSIAENCSNNIHINRFLFNPNKGDERLRNLQIIGMEKWGVTWKGEIDLLVVNHIDKEVYNIDFKTTSKPIAWFGYEYYVKYKYHRQQALYLRLARHFLEKKGYNIEEWSFYTRCIVIETTGLNEVACIPIPHDILADGEELLKEAADQIVFYNNNGWDKTISYVKNYGLEIIDWDEFRK